LCLKRKLKEKRKPVDKMIPVIKLEYWDGSKYLIRTDVRNWDSILRGIRAKKRAEFLTIKLRDQIKVAQSGGMVNKVYISMKKSDYLRVKKGQ